MSLVIRLSQFGKKGERKFRISVSEKRSKKEGRAVAFLGWLEKREKTINQHIDRKRYDYWVARGAKPSPTVEKLLK